MYITLEKQYKFFKSLQECELDNLKDIKRTIKYIEFDIDIKESKENIDKYFKKYINSQIEFYNQQIKAITEINTKLNDYCNKKEVNQQDPIFKTDMYLESNKLDLKYNDTDIGFIVNTLRSIIADLYKSGFTGLEKIMDAKDCNLCIAEKIKNDTDHSQKMFDKQNLQKALK